MHRILTLAIALTILGCSPPPDEPGHSVTIVVEPTDDPILIHRPLPTTQGSWHDYHREGRQTIHPLAKKDQLVVVFWGDSITEDGYYVQAVENYFASALRDQSVRFHNAGTGGNTYQSGLERFDAEVKTQNPSIVVVAFGINDAGYEPYSQTLYDMFVKNVRLALQRLRDETNAFAYVLSPSYYDASGAGDAKPSRPYYDAVLARYADAQRQIVDEFPRAAFVDIRSAMKRLTADERQKDPRFTLVPDKVHPNRLGGVVIANELLKAMARGQERSYLGLEVASTPLEKSASSLWYPYQLLGGSPLAASSSELTVLTRIVASSLFTRFTIQSVDAQAHDRFDIELVFAPSPDSLHPTIEVPVCRFINVPGDYFNKGLQLDYPCYAVWQRRMNRILELSERRRRLILAIRRRTHGAKSLLTAAARRKAYAALAETLKSSYVEADDVYREIIREANGLVEARVYRR